MKTLNLTYDGAIALNGGSARPVLSRQNVGQWLKTLKLWSARARQRRVLATLDADQLNDIGLSSADVQREISKPFWA